ncbi:diguanylate cyclase [Viridibacterium curvum]|uniref:diguanylate cyclase n=1 Tax=Viridibacterium curvum TaxID=1101404 RepID=A0ABP9QS35_9RHOO
MRQILRDGALVSFSAVAAGSLGLLAGMPAAFAVIASAIAAGVVASIRLGADTQRLSDSLQTELDKHRATRDYIQRVLDAVPMPIYVKDAESRYLIVNKAQCEQWGKPVESLLGVCSPDLAPNATVANTIRTEDAAVLSGEIVYKEEEKRHAATGEEQFRIVTKARCLDTEGKYVIVCSLYDTTHWRQTERALQQALERETQQRQRTQSFIQRLIDVIPDPLYIKNKDGAFLVVNEAFARERGTPRHELIGKVAHVIAFSKELARGTPEEDLAVLAGTDIDKEQHFVHPLSGEERYRHVIKRRSTDLDGSPVIVGAHLNITRWKIAERELARLASEDELTDLPNRRRFLDDAARLMSQAERHDEPLSLLLFDIDHFKRINDEHGHNIGDKVLRQLAARLRQQLRAEDLPCRWGGEEFAVLLPMSDDSQAMQVAERLRTSIEREPFDDNSELVVTISCGVTRWRVGETLESLVARADTALYAAKNAGRNTCQLAS